MNDKNRDGGNQQKCGYRTGKKEMVEYLIAECSNYERQRGELIVEVTVISRKEWTRRLEENNWAIFTVLGLYGDKQETKKRLVKLVKVFLAKCWEKRAQMTE